MFEHREYIYIIDKESTHILDNSMAKIPLFLQSIPLQYISHNNITRHMGVESRWGWFLNIVYLLKKLHGEINMDLMLGENNRNSIKYWSSGVFSVGNEMKIHTHGIMCLGSISMHSSSTKKELSTKIFDEIYLVADNDIILQVMWAN